MQLLSTLLLALNAVSVAWAAPTVPDPAEAAAAAWDGVVNGEGDLEKRADVTMVLWRDAGYKGDYITTTEAGAHCQNVPISFNDAASSVVVGTGYACVLYADANCMGDYRIFDVQGYPGYNSDLSTIGFNDVTSSYTCYRKS